MAEPGPLVPVGTLAKLFDLTDRRIQQLAGDRVIPKATRGQYPLIESVRGYVRYLQDRVSGDGSLPAESTRLKRAQAEKAEQENRARAGELIDRDEITEVFSQALLTIRAGALQLPGRVAPVLSPDAPIEAEGVIRAEVVEFLNDAAASLGRLGNGSSVSADPTPARRKAARRVGKRKTKVAGRKRRGRKT